MYSTPRCTCKTILDVPSRTHSTDRQGLTMHWHAASCCRSAHRTYTWAQARSTLTCTMRRQSQVARPVVQEFDVQLSNSKSRRNRSLRGRRRSTHFSESTSVLVSQYPAPKLAKMLQHCKLHHFISYESNSKWHIVAVPDSDPETQCFITLMLQGHGAADSILVFSLTV